MDLEKDGNLIEAVFWVVFALVLLVKAVKGASKMRRVFLTLSATVFVFGVSDIVEAHTGAWWRPWRLLVWKVGCVLGLFLGFRQYYRLYKAEQTKGSVPTLNLER